jgi:hypothetical protein
MKIIYYRAASSSALDDANWYLLYTYHTDACDISKMRIPCWERSAKLEQISTLLPIKNKYLVRIKVHGVCEYHNVIGQPGGIRFGHRIARCRRLQRAAQWTKALSSRLFDCEMNLQQPKEQCMHMLILPVRF